MCGIFGMIGDHVNRADLLQMLCWLNRERGSHSAGIASGDEIFKRAIDPVEFCERNRFMRLASIPGVTLGHTRFATKGSICRENAHPFKFGRTIGTHNGMVDNFEELQYNTSQVGAPEFAVDSEVLIWLVENYGSYAPARGSLNLAYHQGDGALHLVKANNPLSVAKLKTCVVYSSDHEHLNFALDAFGEAPKAVELKNNQHYTITPDLKFSIEALGYDTTPEWQWYGNTSTYYGTKGKSTRKYARKTIRNREAESVWRDHENCESDDYRITREYEDYYRTRE